MRLDQVIAVECQVRIALLLPRGLPAGMDSPPAWMFLSIMLEGA